MRGWVATPQADRDQVRAITAGGRVACISALARWGLWSADDRRLHIAMPPERRMASGRSDLSGDTMSPPAFHPLATVGSERELALRNRGRAVVHWSTPRFPHFAELDWIVPPAEAVLQALRCQRHIEHAVASADSALHAGVISDIEWGRVLELLPRHLARLGELVDPRADSGLESRIRVRLELLGHKVDIQVSLDGVGRLDAIIDDLVVLELDGDAYHSTREQRQNDSHRMLVSLSRYGLPTVRATYAQAIYEWDLVYAALTRQLSIARTYRRS